MKGLDQAGVLAFLAVTMTSNGLLTSRIILVATLV